MPRPLIRGTRLAVAAGHPRACQAAVRLAGRGGNAVDAAIGAAAALCVVLPEACGLAGDALLLVRPAHGSTRAYNGSGAAPRGIDVQAPRSYGATAAVPGAVAAWQDAHQHAGRLAWGELFADAVALARDGFALTNAGIAAIARNRERLEYGAPAWVGLDLPAGALIVQPELARAVETVADLGADGLYRGWVASALAAAAEADGGALSEADLAEHRTVVREPVHSTYGTAALIAQPPVSQAILAPLALRALERSNARGVLERRHAAIEAIEGAFGVRDQVAAPDAMARLLDAELEVDLERAARRGGPVLPSHTTSIATCDEEGTIVSMLISVFDEFGSARLAPDTGLFLNDRLVGFSSDPESPNALRPGERPVHTLSPMIVEESELQRSYALATPGADGQVQTLVQVIDAIVAEGAELSASLHRARWRSAHGRLMLEEGFDADLAVQLAELGHQVEWQRGGAQAFGAAVIAGVEHAHGTLFAASDPRREAWAAAI